MQFLNCSAFIPCSLLQKILEHVITIIPASGLQVLPVAKVLADKLVTGSNDLQTAKENGQLATNFLAKLSLIVASAMPGAREDLKELPWRELPLIPVAEEIKKPSKNVYTSCNQWVLNVHHNEVCTNIVKQANL